MNQLRKKCLDVEIGIIARILPRHCIGCKIKVIKRKKNIRYHDTIPFISSRDVAGGDLIECFILLMVLGSSGWGQEGRVPRTEGESNKE